MTVLHTGLPPQALRHHAVDLLVAILVRGDATIHGHAGERVGIEPRQGLLLRKPVDHGHGGAVHCLVQVGVFGIRWRRPPHSPLSAAPPASPSRPVSESCNRCLSKRSPPARWGSSRGRAWSARPAPSAPCAPRPGTS